MRKLYAKRFCFLMLCLASIGFLSPVQARSRKQTQSARNDFPLVGRLLPIDDPFDRGDVRNYDWQEYLCLLHVRELRVWHWPQAYNEIGEAQRIKKSVRAQLKAAGYAIEDFRFDYESGPLFTHGFNATKAGRVIAAVWISNGSHLMLYWGDSVPLTRQEELDRTLVMAASEGDFERAQNLIREGASPAARNCTGRTVLEVAADNKRTKIARPLIQKLERLDNDVARKALYAAAGNNDVELVTLLLDKGAPLTRDDGSGSLLIEAASGNAVEVLRLLLERKIQFENPDLALRAAASGRLVAKPPRAEFLDAVQLLLPGSSERGKGEALAHAAIFGLPQTTRLLLDAGANVHEAKWQGAVVGWSGYPLLCRAVSHDEDVQRIATVQNLIRAGADVNAKAENGATALMIAAQHSNPVLVQLLLDNGADPNAQDEKGDTALMWIKRQSFLRSRLENRDAMTTQTIIALVAGGAQTDIRNNKGLTPLNVAVASHELDIVKALKEAGAVR